VTVPVLDNDQDPEGGDLTLVSATQGENGSAVANNDGTITYTPNPGFTGPDSLEYTVKDNNGNTDNAMVHIFVKPVNHAPVAVDDEAGTTEDSTITVAVLDNDSDVDGDSLSVVSITQPGNGSAVLNQDNTVSYTPNLNFTGTDTLTYMMSDGNGGYALLFDGIDDFVSTALNVSPTLLPVTTWEAWVFPTCVPSDSAQVILRGADRGVSIEPAVNDTSKFGVLTGTGVWQPVAVTAQQWQHIAVVYTQDNILFYKNGEEFSFGSAPTDLGSTDKLKFGRVPAGFPFQGCLDEIRVWDVARTQSEIQDNLTQLLPGNESGLAGYWRLDDGSGDTATDLTGNGHPGLLGAGISGSEPLWLTPISPLVHFGNAVEATVSITVAGSNDPPSAFRRIIPIDGSAHQPGGLTFMWTHSYDLDGDAVNYTLSLNSTGLIDTSFTMRDTSLTVDLRNFNLPAGSFSVSWMVRATDGSVETEPSNGMGSFTLDVITSVATEDDELMPTEFVLHSNYPNPFNPSTTISFGVPEASEVTLAIYNMRGQLIQTLQSGFIAAGQHSVVWDGTDFRGAKVASGIYVYRLEGKGIVVSKKLVFTK